MKQLLVRAWRDWMEIAGYFGDFQARLLLTVFYAVILLPFAVIARALTDPFHARKAPEVSGWHARREHDVTLQSSRQQF